MMAPGDLTVSTDGPVAGMIGGNLHVAPGVKAEVSAMVGGDLVVGRGAHVKLTGMVAGRIENQGGQVEGGGMVGHR